jgi:two-component system response regulator AtoC
MTPAAFPTPETQLSNVATREADALRPVAESTEPFRLLMLVSSPDHSQAFEFGAHRTLTLGRSEPADIQLADLSLSRLHARFTREGEAVRVTDLDSRNGTWVLGSRIRETLLRPGQSVVLGSVTVTVQVSASAGTAMLGLRSAETMLRCIEDEWTRSQAFRRPLSVLILRALRKGEVSAAEIATDCLPKLRPIDRAGLYDKSALLILLPEANADVAARIGSELCAAVRGRGQLVCGVASYPEAGTSPEQLVSAAWQASRETSSGRAVLSAPRAPHVRDPQTDTIVRKSPAMIELSRMVERVAPRPIAVLVTGET